MHVFLSFHSKDQALAEAVHKGLKRIDASTEIFLSPVSLGAGFWLPKLAEGIAAANAFLLLIGPKGIGPWQEVEYYTAFDRHVQDKDFILVPLFVGVTQAPGLPFLRNLHLIDAPAPLDEQSLHKLLGALRGQTPTRETPLWKLINPYRGLEAMTEANADYFHGRSEEVSSVLDCLARKPSRYPVLIGASGVGKSSVARAGVLSALKAMRWPPGTDAARPWPRTLHDSRNWVLITMRPGSAPLTALSTAITRVWQLNMQEPDEATLPRKWAASLMRGDSTLGDLLSATQERIDKREGRAPSRVLLYVDQGEELYSRAHADEGRRFSALMAEGLADERLLAFSSLRADYFDRLQVDEMLFATHEHIDVAPLSRAKLAEIVTTPATALGVNFEDARTVDRIVTGASTRAGALPLLSYLLHDMWSAMVERGDAVLRLPTQAVDIGGVLARRADEFLADRPAQTTSLRQLLTLKLCSVPSEGEPIRRETTRLECTAEQWDLACELADYPWRLVVASERDDGDAIAEVAHEELLRAWPQLNQWLVDEHEFLVFKHEIERAERRWRGFGMAEDALLAGIDLVRAEEWLEKRSADLSPSTMTYIQRSIGLDRARKARQLRFQRRVSWGAAAAAVAMTVLGAIAVTQRIEADRQREQADAQRNAAQIAQSLFLADPGRLPGEAFGTLMLRALAGLPEPVAWPNTNPRPYVLEAERSAFAAYMASRELALLVGHSEAINTMAISDNGQRAVTGSIDATVRLWDLVRKTELAAIRETDSVASVAISADGRWIVTAVDGRPHGRLWDAESSSEIMTLGGHAERVTSVAISGDGAVMAAAGDSAIRVWRDQSILRDLPVPEGVRIACVAISRDGRRIVAAAYDGSAYVWNTVEGDSIRFDRGEDSPILVSVAINADGSHIATGAQNGSLVVWDVDKGTEHWSSEANGQAIRSIAFDRGGTRIVTGSADHTARVWDLKSGASGAVFHGHVGAITGVALASDGVVTASADKTLRLWRLSAVSDERVLAPDTVGQIRQVLFGPDGKLLAIDFHGVTVRIWDARAGRVIASIGHTATPSAISLDLKAGRAAAGFSDGVGLVWDLSLNKEVHRFISPAAPITSVTLRPDGSGVIYGGGDNVVRLWAAGEGQPKALQHTFAAPVRAILMNATGDKIITAAASTIRFWDAATGKESESYLEPRSRITIHCLATNAKGTRLYSGSSDRAVMVWDSATRKRIGPPLEGTAEVTSLAIAPDEARLVTGGFDGSVRLWDVASGLQIGIVATFPSLVDTLAISPDGKWIAAATKDQGVHVFPLIGSLPSLINRIRHDIPRCLTPSQLEAFHLRPAEPPRWCITGPGNESEQDSTKWRPKWPYHEPKWREWQLKKDRGEPAKPPPS